MIVLLWQRKQSLPVLQSAYSTSTISDILILVRLSDSRLLVRQHFLGLKATDHLWGLISQLLSWCEDGRDQTKFFLQFETTSSEVVVTVTSQMNWLEKKKKVPVTVRHQDACCQHLKLSSEMAWKIPKKKKRWLTQALRQISSPRPVSRAGEDGGEGALIAR